MAEQLRYDAGHLAPRRCDAVVTFWGTPLSISTTPLRSSANLHGVVRVGSAPGPGAIAETANPEHVQSNAASELKIAAEDMDLFFSVRDENLLVAAAEHCEDAGLPVVLKGGAFWVQRGRGVVGTIRSSLHSEGRKGHYNLKEWVIVSGHFHHGSRPKAIRENAISLGVDSVATIYLVDCRLPK